MGWHATDRLFADDPVALRILAGLANDLSAAEIRGHYGLSEVEYDTARRRMRRTLLRHGLTWSSGREQLRLEKPALAR